VSARCRLYLITPPAFEPASFAVQLETAISGGDIACLQIRLKDVPDAAVLEAARILTPIAQDAGIAVIINDRPDLAKQAGADGVHIGQEDAPFTEARRIMGKGIIGVTCHASRHLAMEAGEAGADYIAFGAFFDTKTKVPKARADLDLLHWWSEIFEIPCVAIGGITIENAAPLVQAGADFLAVSAGVWDYPDGPKAAVEGFNKLFRA
jgi:thiamine-phosphate pyrophosphorylase